MEILEKAGHDYSTFSRKMSTRPAGRISRVNDRAVSRTDVDAAPDERNTSSEERSALKLYLREIGKTALLTPKEEVELAKRIQKGDEAARQRMIKANLRLVVKIANDYSNFGLPILDLISEGNIGLVKAVERFDPTKGGKLSTYASWWIKQSIKRALANQSKTIRLPVHLIDKIARMRRTELALQEEFGRMPTNDELAYELEMSVNKVAHLKTVSLRPSSLDAPVGEDDNTQLGELVGDENADSPIDSLSNKALLTELLRLVDQLEDREAEIIRLRFGLGGEKPLTLEEVGERFDITRERVRQLQNLALHSMRKALIAGGQQLSVDEIRDQRIAEERMRVLKEYFVEKEAEEPALN